MVEEREDFSVVPADFWRFEFELGVEGLGLELEAFGSGNFFEVAGVSFGPKFEMR